MEKTKKVWLSIGIGALALYILVRIFKAVLFPYKSAFWNLSILLVILFFVSIIIVCVSTSNKLDLKISEALCKTRNIKRISIELRVSEEVVIKTICKNEKNIFSNLRVMLSDINEWVVYDVTEYKPTDKIRENTENGLKDIFYLNKKVIGEGNFFATSIMFVLTAALQLWAAYMLAACLRIMFFNGFDVFWYCVMFIFGLVVVWVGGINALIYSARRRKQATKKAYLNAGVVFIFIAFAIGVFAILQVCLPNIFW